MDGEDAIEAAQKDQLYWLHCYMNGSITLERMREQVAYFRDQEKQAIERYVKENLDPRDALDVLE